MAELEFKYLNEIDISDSLTDSAHVIIEDGGNIRRAPMGQLITGGGVTSWNDLTDKPFGEEGSGATIEWDGNTEGRDVFTLVEGMNYYKISDILPTKSELLGGTVLHNNGGDVTSVELTEDTVIEQDGCILCGEQAIVIQNTSFSCMGLNCTANSTGLYFFYALVGETISYTPKLTYGSTTIKTLDEKFIPDTIARVGDVGVTSWNELEDKPFGEESGGAVIEWDGNTEGLEFFTAEAPYYHVSDSTPTIDELIGASYETDMVDSGVSATSITSEMLTVIGDCIAIGTEVPLIAIATIDNAATGDSGTTISKAGVYFVNAPGYGYASKLTYGSTTIHTLDEKFIPDTIARKSDIASAGGTSSWNDLTDKPFYSNGMVEKVLLEESTFENPEDDGVEYCDELIVVPDLVPGNTYTVIWDNVEYECTAVLHSDGATVLGNLSFYNHSNEDGEPFCIWEVYDYGVYYGIITYTSGSHTIKIMGAIEDIHKIDPKYLPDGVGYKTSEIKTLVDKTVEVTEEYEILNDNGPIAFVSGEAYDVTFNGEKYSCIANPDAESGGVFLGNGALIGVTMANEDVPFCCLSVPTGEALLFADTGTHAIKIDGVVENIHQIDSKYLKLKKLSFSGYSSGTYDGTDTLNIRIPSPPYIQQSMTDLVAGESPLPSGAIYLVYE